MIRWLALLACALTIVVTAASAYLRLGQSTPVVRANSAPVAASIGGNESASLPSSASSTSVDPSAGQTLQTSAAPLSGPDAVVRLLHRVSAMIVGLLALAIVLFGWARMGTGDRLAASLAIVDTLFLSWLGRYTPHDLPLVTLGNVLGGFTLAAAFGWIAAGPGLRRPTGTSQQAGRAPRSGSSRYSDRPASPLGSGVDAVRGIVGLAWAAVAMVCLQTSIGLLISLRRAIDACVDLACMPTGAWDRALFDPGVAMTVAAPDDGRPLHVVHRGLALLLIALGLLLWRRLRAADASRHMGAPQNKALGAGLLAILVLLAGAGLATAFGTPAPRMGTVHNVLAGSFVVLLVAIARRAGHWQQAFTVQGISAPEAIAVHDRIDSR